MISGVRAITGGWAAVIDDAVIAVRTHDVLGGHLPLVGIYTSLTAAAHASTRLHHLGPLEFWLFAVPARLWGPAATGLALAAAVVNALAAIGAVWIGHRLGGVRLAAFGAAAAGLLAWSLGGQILHDPWNPHLAIFPFLFLLLACWSLATGDVWMFPVVAFTASFVAQLHLTFVAPAALTAIWASLGCALALRRQRSDDPVASERVRRATRRSLTVAGVVALACWSGPIADEVAGSANLSGLTRAVLGGGYQTVGPRIAWRDLVHATSLPPVWLHPSTGIVKPDTAPSAVAVATSVLVLGALVTATAWAWRRRSWRLAAVGTTALVACVGTFVTAARTPAAYHYQDLIWARRVWWPVGLFVWIALGCAVGTWAAARWPQWWRRAELPAVAAGLLAVAVFVVAAWPRLGPAQDYGSAGFAAVRTLGSAVNRSLPGSGPWLVRSEGSFAVNIVGPGVASELVYRGRPILVANTSFPDFGDAHFVGPDRRATATLAVVSGVRPEPPGPGYRVVARWDPADVSGVFRGYHENTFLIPVTPITVYLSTGHRGSP